MKYPEVGVMYTAEGPRSRHWQIQYLLRARFLDIALLVAYSCGGRDELAFWASPINALIPFMRAPLL
jgi:hypothetical protein